MSGKADIPLKARNVDLQAVLAYLDVEGLSGEGILSGELPLIFEDGRARIVDGVLRSEGPGAIRYVGAASAAAAEAGEDARLAFDLLRNLRYTSLDVAINGALDGQLVFNMKFQGEGDVTVQKRNVSNVPVLYRVNLSVENIDLVRKAGLSGFIRSEIQRALEEDARRE
ncbi:MAG: YdbH domain-containing protein [Parvularculaceae bacterium]